MENRNKNFSKGFKGNRNDTSWEKVSKWYDNKTGEKGHFFQENLIMPKVVELLNLEVGASLLDLGCGQGVLSRHIPQDIDYLGLDLSSSLIQSAKQRNQNKNFKFETKDVSKELNLNKKFSNAAIILALQNIENIDQVFANVSKYLEAGGKFLIVLNHPAFRIPRQSSWEIDEQNKLQYRRVNKYMVPLKVPITMNPGEKVNEKVTWSFHNPLAEYSKLLKKHNFYIDLIDEWVSPKESVGKAAKMENRAREEFPMFMAILAVKK
jgi:ubiquinone/menaquinone biosynthesis C-methylase UbiE